MTGSSLLHGELLSGCLATPIEQSTWSLLWYMEWLPFLSRIFTYFSWVSGKKNRYVSPALKLFKWSLSCFSFGIHARVVHYHNKWQFFALIINTVNAPIQFNSVSAFHVLYSTLHTIKNSEDEQVWPLFLANLKFSVDRWGSTAQW